MAKVIRPLFSEDVRGHFGRKWIYRRGGVVTRYFKPRDAKTDLQLAARDAFRNMAMSYITQEQADLLYAAISHGHLHSSLSGLQSDDHLQYLNNARHDVLARHGQSSVDHGLIAGLLDDDHPHYFNQTRADARYIKIGDYVWPRQYTAIGESKQNTVTLAPLSDLTVPVQLGRTYLFSGKIFFISENTAGMRWRFRITGTTFLTLMSVAQDYALTGGASLSSTRWLWNTATPATILVPTTNTYYGCISFDISHIQGASDGGFTFQYAQNVSDSDYVSILRGSYVNWREVY